MLEVKTVNFQGSKLLGIKSEDGKLYTGVSYICRGIGLNKNQKDRQVKNLQKDLLLSKGCVKFDAGVIDKNNPVLAIDLDYLPLWLAKIAITPKMQKENPQLVNNLLTYQLKAKDVLAKVFEISRKLEAIEYNGNIDGLVYSKNSNVTTTSRIIAKETGKEHKHVLRDIRDEINKLNKIHSPNLVDEVSKIIDDFKEVDYISENGQTYIEYEIGELGTMQIMLRYSTECRARFILAFNKMKENINNMFKARLIENVLPQDNRNRQFVYIIENIDNCAIKIGGWK